MQLLIVFCIARRFDHTISSVVNDLVDKTVATVESQSGSGYRSVVFGWSVDKTNKFPRNERFKRNTSWTTFEVRHNFGQFSDLFDIKTNIVDMYDQFMRAQLVGYRDNDVVSVGIRHENPEIKDLFIPTVSKINFDEEGLYNVLDLVTQSNKVLLLNGKLYFQVNITECMEGSGRTKAPQTTDERKRSSLSVVTIKNKDKGCAFRSLAVSIGKIEGLKDHEWIHMTKDQYKAQTLAAQRLATKCGMTLDHSVNINDFNVIQQNIEYKIVVIDGTNYKNRLFVGNKTNAKSVYILHTQKIDEDSHFDAITNIKGFMNSDFYCDYCNSTYSHLYEHKCEFICAKCFRSPPCQLAEEVTCVDCNRVFSNMDCYTTHLANGQKSICNIIKVCNICSMRKEKNHVCNQRKCRKCGETYALEVHHCNVKKLNIEKLKEQDLKLKIIVAYDIESQQKKVPETVINGKAGESYTHVADLLVAMITCDLCWNGNTTSLANCDTCGEFKKVYSGKKCVKEFNDYIFNTIAKNAVKAKAEVYVFAHNAKGYDNHFVLNDMLTRYNLNKVEVIMSGNKIMKASTANVRFLDSLLMFQQPLAALPKAFGFENIVTKGFFPHMFHKDDSSLEYVGPLPEKHYFGTEFMKPSTLNEFNIWYSAEQSKNNIYNLKEELKKYCENDVLILLNCVQKFREIFKEVTQIDPITRCFTLASMGLEIFKAQVLGDIKMGVTPVFGYSDRRKQSVIGKCWLDFQQKLINRRIEREVQIDGYFVDGFDRETNTVFEYNGCYWHGCECQHRVMRDSVLQFKNGNCSKWTPDQMLANTNKKRNQLKRTFNYVEDTDCSLAKKRCKNEESFNKEMDSYINHRKRHYEELKKHGGVVIRDSFFGGRTNNIKFYEDLTDDHLSRILYYDFRSLYPTVLKYDSFPVGHPIVINEFECTDISSYFGFVKCKVSAPKNLRIAVLPVRTSDKKLVFPLCSKCCEMKYPDDCPHSDIERQLIGTWTTIELNAALEAGYVIEQLLEVYHYTEKTDEMFSKYVNMWLKYKQESDGWPAWVKSDEDKEKYINDFLEREGVELNINDIKKNPGLRFIAKLFLNTLWGKFAQRPNLEQTTICKEYKDYWKLANDSEIVIKGETMINDDTLVVHWQYKSDDRCDNINTSLAIASFVTSYARTRLLKLINEIEVIPGRFIYMDTDR